MDVRDLFLLRPDLAYLNHGGFGATPAAVLDARLAIIHEVEADPTRFHTREIGPRLAAALVPVAAALGADAGSLAWVPNATTGLNLVARSLLPELRPGDELLLTDLEYGSQRMLWEWVAAQAGARVVEARLDGVPDGDAPEVLAAAVTDRTRMALVSHITSATARRLPVQQISARLRPLGVMVVVDGAHAPGQLPDLELGALGADCYVGNLHKWAAAPRSSAILHAAPPVQARLDPLVVSWGGTDRSTPLAGRVDLPGTIDASTWLASPAGLDFHRTHLAPARPAARRLLGEAADRLGELGYRRLASQDDDLLMAAFELRPGQDPEDLEARLAAAGVQAIVSSQSGRRLLRICVAWYTTGSEVERLLAVCR